MIKKEYLLEAIAECQGERNPNANTCIKLAAYYTILDNIDNKKEDYLPQVPQATYSFASNVSDIGHIGESDFLTKIEGKNTEEILLIMDELMTTLQIVNPRLYEGVMRKMSE